MSRARWIRTALALHRLTALALAGGLALYVGTGFAMLHPRVVPGGAATRTSVRPVPLGPAEMQPGAVGRAVRRALDLRGRVREVAAEADGWRVVVVRPGERTEVRVPRAGGDAQVRVTRAAPARTLEELHELRHHEGPWPFRLWALWVDAVALALVGFALSGVALWALVRPDRVGAWLLGGASLYVLGSIAWLSWAP